MREDADRIIIETFLKGEREATERWLLQDEQPRRAPRAAAAAPEPAQPERPGVIQQLINAAVPPDRGGNVLQEALGAAADRCYGGVQALPGSE